MKIKDQLESMDLRPTKGRGQNFLFDQGAIHEIVKFGSAKKGDKIVEIGPGLGALTQELVPYGDITAIEIEEKFATRLKGLYPEIKIISQDVRQVDFSQVGDNLVVFGNLPYSLSTDIVFHVLSYAQVIDRAIFLLQKEFVQRMAAEPGGKEYGTLSVGCQLSAQVRKGPIFAGNLFHPPTRVESQVVELKMRKDNPYFLSHIERVLFQRVVKASFFKRRKKLINSIKESGFFKSEDVVSALNSSGLDIGARAETISVKEYVALTKEFALINSIRL
ncbi:MAG: 16S rRNA (adenine(1518)-N(6)/adenine(1519)-N(6))-dimethyltransferase RsmA [bacterium]|nr:16S rRNA (adenine(1518)-N(6)/adenine(1519)-N(6))-dimethyltransferase RsmA [bacterium]